MFGIKRGSLMLVVRSRRFDGSDQVIEFAR
jgi:hypothetical protein